MGTGSRGSVCSEAPREAVDDNKIAVGKYVGSGTTMLSDIESAPVFHQFQMLKGACVYLQGTAKWYDVCPVISIVICRKNEGKNKEERSH